DLYNDAVILVRAAAERAKPNESRLREYTDNALPRLRQRLLAPDPRYPDIEELGLSFSLERMREYLGPDDPFVHLALGRESPDSLAARLVRGTRLGDAAERRRLWDGGAAAVSASRDPMIEFARKIDPEARKLRKAYEDRVEAPVTLASERI